MPGSTPLSPLLLDLPFRGRWMARNSPADRVPSHGTHLFGSTYAIDFVAVDARGRSASLRWRSVFSSEPPERFRAFGQPLLAPVSGTVARVHDDEPDHVARRSLPAGLPYLLGQSQRARRGPAAIAGNHLVIEIDPDPPPLSSDEALIERRRGASGPYVLLAHLRAGSLRVTEGDRVRVGDPVAECGNSGNSTQPHVHVQATDSIEWHTARGIPLAFRRPHTPGDEPRSPRAWLPRNGEAFEVGGATDAPETADTGASPLPGRG